MGQELELQESCLWPVQAGAIRAEWWESAFAGVALMAWDWSQSELWQWPSYSFSSGAISNENSRL